MVLLIVLSGCQSQMQVQTTKHPTFADTPKAQIATIFPSDEGIVIRLQ